MTEIRVEIRPHVVVRADDVYWRSEMSYSGRLGAQGTCLYDLRSSLYHSFSYFELFSTNDARTLEITVRQETQFARRFFGMLNVKAEELPHVRH